jgi:hypothetical protein
VTAISGAASNSLARIALVAYGGCCTPAPSELLPPFDEANLHVFANTILQESANAILLTSY